MYSTCGKITYVVLKLHMWNTTFLACRHYNEAFLWLRSWTHHGHVRAHQATYMYSHFNPRMLKVFRQPKTSKGGGGYHPHPLDFCLPVRIFWKYFYLYCMTLKIKVKHFCMTFHISGCKHDTKLILVSILTFSRSRISQMLKTIPWPWRLILELKVTHIHCMTFINSGCIHDADLTLVTILTFSRSRISENPKSVTWPWCLILKI